MAELDVAYRPTKTTVSIPGSEIGNTGQTTFTHGAVYDPISGAMTLEGRAAAGDLGEEWVTYNYEDYGLLHDMGGLDTYLRQSDWDAYGRNIRSTVNPWGTQIVATNTYDEPTGRLLTQYIDKQTAATGSVQNTTYAYNQAGQVTAIRAIPNNTPAATDLQCFSYDHLGRLTTAWSDTGQLNQPTPSLGGQGACANATPTSGAAAPAKTTVGGGAAYWQEYTYDLAGNRTKLVNRDPAGDPAKDLRTDQTFPAPGTRNTPTTASGTGGGTGGPHALATGKYTYGWSAGTQGTDQYDAAGNTTKINNPGGNKILNAGFVLKSGESVRSNGAQLTMQADGNLVLSSLRSGQAIWSTSTQNHPGAWATMQADGNFVVYDPQRVALWSSKTYVGAGSGYFAVVQDDGKLIVYAPGWQSKWSTPTWNAVDAANSATLTWDVEGKLGSLTQGTATTTYVYDADGNQLVRRNPGKVTVNLGGGDELTYDTGSKTRTGTRYYTIPGGITLVRQGPTRLTYQFSDHHGTNNLSIDSETTTESRRTFDPFGATRGPGSLSTPWSGDKGYVGGLKDDATGFTNLGARQYQPSTGRFLSPDPILDAGDPLQWNAYAYSNNNPVNRSDPGGLKSEECGTLYDCGSAGTITMKNHEETTANNVPEQTLAREQQQWQPKVLSDGDGNFLNQLAPCRGNTHMAAHGYNCAPASSYFGEMKKLTSNALSGDKTARLTPEDIVRMWYRGDGEKNPSLVFGSDSVLAAMVASDEHVLAIQKQLTQGFQHPGWYDPVMEGEWVTKNRKGGASLNGVKDLLALLGLDGTTGTGFIKGDGGSRADAVLGSYSLKYQVVSVDKIAKTMTVNYHVNNTTGWTSFCHAGCGRTDTTTGQGASITQDIYWTQVLDLTRTYYR
ncbi:hypothetical protein OG535_30370 [Kitasatospora sp. NBC_00085]|uniref:RHS repeat-associated core domain-containing protein n=1 Tax=unclassified Kitasatospora TaxID=2633591 RepID=UPI00324C736D